MTANSCGKNSHYYLTRVEVPLAQVELVADLLLEGGALSVDVAGEEAEENGAQEIPMLVDGLGPGEVLWPRWQTATLRALFTSLSAAQQEMDAVLAHCGVSGPWTLAPLSDADWVCQSQSQFPPQFHPPGLHIVASWHPAPQGPHLVLDPGNAFGTGTHPTTALCLSWLAEHLPTQRCQRAMDYGCGSGILALSAALLGVEMVYATDVDTIALQVCADNARRNHLPIHVFSVDDPLPAPCDLLMANILSGPLIALAPLLCAGVRPGGQLLLSGILEKQVREVSEAYWPWADLQVCGKSEGWVALLGNRRTS